MRSSCWCTRVASRRSPNVGDINGCAGDLKNSDGSPSDIAKIISRLDNAVDLVISGHTHAAYNCSTNTVEVSTTGVGTPRPTGLPNSVGRLVPVTSASAFGRVLTDVDVVIDPRANKVLSVSPTNRLVDRTDADAKAWVAANPEVNNLVQAYNLLTAPLANKVIATDHRADDERGQPRGGDGGRRPDRGRAACGDATGRAGRRRHGLHERGRRAQPRFRGACGRRLSVQRHVRQRVHGPTVRQQPGDDDPHPSAAQGLARAAVPGLPRPGDAADHAGEQRHSVQMERRCAGVQQDRRVHLHAGRHDGRSARWPRAHRNSSCRAVW